MKNKRELIIALIVLTVLLFSFLFISRKNTNKKSISNSLNVLKFEKNSNSSNLEVSYFDDFRGVWGDGTPDGNISWQAGHSQYAERSMPTSVIHPLTEFKAEQEKILLIKRSDIKNIFFGEDATKIIDENIANYGSLLGGFFSRKGEIITSHATFDVDSDGVKEDIVETGNMGGNHFPHNGYIIKNNTIVWYVGLDAGSIDQTKDGNGFYIKSPIRDDGSSMCCPNGYRLYRVIYDKKDEFIPVWEQEVHYLKFDK